MGVTPEPDEPLTGDAHAFAVAVREAVLSPMFLEASVDDMMYGRPPRVAVLALAAFVNDQLRMRRMHIKTW